MLDRIDVCSEVREICYRDIRAVQAADTSEEIRRRTEQAHRLQNERFADCSYSFNSQMPIEDVRKFCQLDTAAEDWFQDKYDEYHLSARTYCKVLRTARTIADLADSRQVLLEHVEEALFYRSPEQKYWRRY